MCKHFAPPTLDKLIGSAFLVALLVIYGATFRFMWRLSEIK